MPNIPTKDLQDAPSWPQAQAAQKAWNAVRVTTASDEAKQAAAESYKAAMRQCYSEIGLTRPTD